MAPRGHSAMLRSTPCSLNIGIPWGVCSRELERPCFGWPRWFQSRRTGSGSLTCVCYDSAQLCSASLPCKVSNQHVLSPVPQPLIVAHTHSNLSPPIPFPKLDHAGACAGSIQWWRWCLLPSPGSDPPPGGVRTSSPPDVWRVVQTPTPLLGRVTACAALIGTRFRHASSKDGVKGRPPPHCGPPPPLSRA